jgi:hypothetical protein
LIHTSQECDDKVILPAEVTVKACFGYAGLLDDEIDAYRANPVLVEKVRGRRQNSVAYVGLPVTATGFS